MIDAHVADVPEQWKEIEGYEGYYSVSTLGRVKSLARSVSAKPCVKAPNGRVIPIQERILKQSETDGRRFVTLWKDHVNLAVSVHKLVTSAFLGPMPDGMERCHNDGKPSNNRLSNLRYDTAVNNNADKRKHGTHIQGSDIPWSKLDERAVEFIRSEYQNGRTQQSLAIAFGVQQPAISRAISGKRWAHVGESP
ncbi:NUMOD4 domain-containing protein [Neorhizobium sp. AL 9.2.2]|uniref:NUMOD4 domain-containing protein n=1 Tax=Neorhizobium sp. AL 9.2.2 TaxID=2712894 RepID=UPI0015743F04|nr:NUMOD4 domain-containing protein [Neorhizobium sp. AL 9.2.2]NSY17229.1 hypothetical protein [Neorhizobium sp. AL 9.2.2]